MVFTLDINRPEIKEHARVTIGQLSSELDKAETLGAPRVSMLRTLAETAEEERVKAGTACLDPLHVRAIRESLMEALEGK